MWRSAQPRICGPSLSRKNRLSAVRARKTTNDERCFDPDGQALQQRRHGVVDSRGRVVARGLGRAAIDAEVRCPADQGVLRRGQLVAQRGGLSGDAAYHYQDDGDRQDDGRDEEQRRPEAAREAALLKPGHHRRGHRRDDRGGDDRRDDRLRQSEDPDGSDDEQGHADREPGRARPGRAANVARRRARSGPGARTRRLPHPRPRAPPC